MQGLHGPVIKRAPYIISVYARYVSAAPAQKFYSLHMSTIRNELHKSPPLPLPPNELSRVDGIADACLRNKFTRYTTLTHILSLSLSAFSVAVWGHKAHVFGYTTRKLYCVCVPCAARLCNIVTLLREIHRHSVRLRRVLLFRIIVFIIADAIFYQN